MFHLEPAEMASMYPVAHRTVPASSFAMDIMQLTEYRQLLPLGDQPLASMCRSQISATVATM